ncbi:hypothetical protein QUF99_05250 [Bacillus sp. DX4.1]|uniref:hypothetical protein n=1 Tax=Bacillus sp. DX4.1 TaxID=3055867 RepID=UPI0025A20657|nr:hypothetical protein [Bacillus sp. DX4.1]MDM5186780.1 hypothetical protein [Bacillus sp. DX4.1]
MSGIIDRFEAEGLRVFGPNKAAAFDEGNDYRDLNVNKYLLVYIRIFLVKLHICKNFLNMDIRIDCS